DNPDGQASRPISRFAVLTKGEPRKGRQTPRLLGMMIEYSRFPGDKEFFGSMLDAVMNSQFVLPIQVAKAEGNKSKINFVGLRNKQDPSKMLVPAFTDVETFNRSLKQGFKVNEKAGKLGVLVLDFARACAIGRSEANNGIVINPFGPVTVTLPEQMLTDISKSGPFKQLFGEKAATMSVAEALSGQGAPGDTLQASQAPQERRKFIITQPKEEGEFKFIAGAIRNYGNTHAAVGKIAVFLSYPEDNPKDRNYVCIVDCPEDKINDIFPEIASCMKPYMKSVKGVQFQLFSRGRFAGDFFNQHPWIYSKLPQ
nr:SseB family protein [Saccharofermentans sp.]